jgi:cytochrome c
MVRNWTFLAQMALVASTAILMCAIEPAFAEASAAERRGLIFVHENCSRCHAIGPVGESPLAKAPPFRTLHLRYPVSDLQRPLLEGIHSDMPRFQLTPNQVTDVMAYFKMFEQK